MDESELPFCVEYARSNRSTCKGCKRKIGKDILRLGVMVKISKDLEDVSPHWYHFNCFFKNVKPSSVDEIAYFPEIDAEDQKRIKAFVEGIFYQYGDAIKLLIKDNLSADPHLPIDMFIVEYAISNRSACAQCDDFINQDEIRLGKKIQEPRTFRVIYEWFHLDCFAKNRKEIGFIYSGDNLPYFDSLYPEDQSIVKKKLPSLNRKR